MVYLKDKNMLILSDRDLQLKNINIFLPKRKIKNLVMSRNAYYNFNTSKIYSKIIDVLIKNYTLIING